MDSEESSSLSNTCKSNDGIQMFLSFACTTWSTHGCQFDMWERIGSCLSASMFSHSVAGCLVLTSTPSCTCCLSALRVRDVYLGQSSVESRL